MLLEDRVAIVSGIGPGLGRDVALAFARQGARLALAARTASRLEAVAKEVEALGARALCVPTDISRREDCEGLVRATRAAFGRVDVLVNNAFHPGSFLGPAESDLGRWRTPFEVNVIGTLTLTQAVIPTLREQRRGSIVMINSMVIREVLPNMVDYAASKAALMAATLGLARELGPAGIRVNAVVPGYIWGDALSGWFRHQARQRGVDPQVVYDEVAGEIALGRIPGSEEIAGAVVFFASDLSCAVTGQALDVNGGHVLRGF